MSGSIPTSSISFSGIVNAYNNVNSTNLSTTNISLSSFRSKSFSDSTTVPSSGAISLNSHFKGKTWGYPGLYTFSSHTFTNCGKTGASGPTLTECRSSYSPSWTDSTSYFNVTQTGYQLWTVPSTASYIIDAYGARGGDNSSNTIKYGKGARLQGTFNLTSGDKYMILVGQMGAQPTGSSPGLYTFSSHTFTNCGKTGASGPTLTECRSSYSPSWTDSTSYFNVTGSYNGIQQWKVPKTGTYTIDAYGAKAGDGGGKTGGYGARIHGTVSLTEGDWIHILVGQESADSPYGSGGGGGTFVIKSPYNSNASILLIAGGGGGTESNSVRHGGETGKSGGDYTNYGNAVGGVNGYGGSGGHGQPGAGFLGDGTGSFGHGGNAPKGFVNGGKGGVQHTDGGFGGGGSGGAISNGGGGGYSGGASGDSHGSGTSGGGGGGSYYDNATGVSLWAADNNGQGKVIITFTGNTNSSPGAQGAGAGGGTFVVKGTNYSSAGTGDVLIVAGGGGAAGGASWNYTGRDADATNTSSTTGGSQGAYGGGGGGGFNNDGSGSNTTSRGKAFTNGGAGGQSGGPYAYDPIGGFGGGASSYYHPGGGGGGYSGGNSGTSGSVDGGFGGGSRNNGTNTSAWAGNNSGHGKVIITLV